MSGLLLPIRRTVPVEAIPDLAAVVRALGMMTEEEGKRLDALVASSWVLVRIDGEGERWRCKGCNGKHEFFTHGCIPIPYRGLQHGLLAYWKNAGAANSSDLTAAQRERVESLNPLFGASLPSLAAHHPETARKLATAENDIDLGAWVLGTIEPITPLQASVYAERINYRARRIVIPVR